MLISIGSSAVKESACNAGDLSLILGSGRSPGEGIGYPLQHSWASFVAQLVKNPAAMRETCLGSIPGLGRSLGEGNCYPLQYSCLENPMDRGAWQATVHGVAKSWTWLSDLTLFEDTLTSFKISYNIVKCNKLDPKVTWFCCLELLTSIKILKTFSSIYFLLVLKFCS